jgi:hypothetical protein
MRKKNISNRRRVALNNLLKVKEPNKRQLAEIEILQKRL